MKYHTDKTNEIIEMLRCLKENAQEAKPLHENDEFVTMIIGIKKESFDFVINNTIELLSSKEIDE